MHRSLVAELGEVSRILPLGATERLARNADIPGSLQQAIRSRLEESLPGVGRAAGIAGMSVRTLQRRLAHEGTSYSRLVDEVRFGMAVRRLGAPGMKLIEIAFELGYSDPAHFTRAFRRWAGVAPREFRRRRMRGQASPW